MENNDKDKRTRGGIGGNKRLLPSFAANKQTFFFFQNVFSFRKTNFPFFVHVKVALEEGQGECAGTHKNLV